MHLLSFTAIITTQVARAPTLTLIIVVNVNIIAFADVDTVGPVVDIPGPAAFSERHVLLKWVADGTSHFSTASLAAPELDGGFAGAPGLFVLE